MKKLKEIILKKENHTGRDCIYLSLARVRIQVDLTVNIFALLSDNQSLYQLHLID